MYSALLALGKGDKGKRQICIVILNKSQSDLFVAVEEKESSSLNYLYLGSQCIRISQPGIVSGLFCLQALFCKVLNFLDSVQPTPNT